MSQDETIFTLDKISFTQYYSYFGYNNIFLECILYDALMISFSLGSFLFFSIFSYYFYYGGGGSSNTKRSIEIHILRTILFFQFILITTCYLYTNHIFVLDITKEIEVLLKFCFRLFFKDLNSFHSFIYEKFLLLYQIIAFDYIYCQIVFVSSNLFPLRKHIHLFYFNMFVVSIIVGSFQYYHQEFYGLVFISIVIFILLFMRKLIGTKDLMNTIILLCYFLGFCLTFLSLFYSFYNSCSILLPCIFSFIIDFSIYEIIKRKNNSEINSRTIHNEQNHLDSHYIENENDSVQNL